MSEIKINLFFLSFSASLFYFSIDKAAGELNPMIIPNSDRSPASSDDRNAGLAEGEKLEKASDESFEGQYKLIAEAIVRKFSSGVGDANNKNSVIFEESIAKISASIDIYRKCASGFKDAKKFCGENTAPILQEISPYLNGLTGLASSTNIVDSCSLIGKAMDVISKGLSVYSTWCGSFKGICKVSCDSIVEKLDRDFIVLLNKDFEKTSSICQTTSVPAKCFSIAKTTNELAQQDLANYIKDTEKSEKNIEDGRKSIYLKQKQCDSDFGRQLISVGLGIANTIVPLMIQAKNCNKETKSGTNPKKQIDEVVDCKKQKYRDFPECLCKANPKLSGCNQYFEQASQKGGFGGSISAEARSPGAVDPSSISAGTQDSPFESKNADNGAIAGPPQGGGGAGLGGGGGGSGSGGQSGGSSHNPLSAKILAGEIGGSGSFGGRQSGGISNYQLENMRKKFGPGSEYAKKLGAYNEARGQIGFPEGPNLFEKVKRPYQDLRHTFLP